MDNGIHSSKSEYKKDTLGTQFLKSCLGKVIILVALIAILLIVAKFTVPSDKEMTYGTLDGICQCIEKSHGVPGDKSDDIVRNGIATFSH